MDVIYDSRAGAWKSFQGSRLATPNSCQRNDLDLVTVIRREPRIMDEDQRGLVSLEEFVSGCMQGRGPAKNLQLVKMSYENKVTRCLAQWPTQLGQTQCFSVR